MYKLILTKPFLNRLNKLISRNKMLRQKTYKTLRQLASKPQHPALHSHKVQTRKYGIRWSSWITSDIRFIWDYIKIKERKIVILDIGSHSGK